MLVDLLCAGVIPVALLDGPSKRALRLVSKRANEAILEATEGLVHLAPPSTPYLPLFFHRRLPRLSRLVIDSEERQKIAVLEGMANAPNPMLMVLQLMRGILPNDMQISDLRLCSVVLPALTGLTHLEAPVSGSETISARFLEPLTRLRVLRLDVWDYVDSHNVPCLLDRIKSLRLDHLRDFGIRCYYGARVDGDQLCVNDRLERLAFDGPTTTNMHRLHKLADTLVALEGSAVGNVDGLPLNVTKLPKLRDLKTSHIPEPSVAVTVLTQLTRLSVYTQSDSQIFFDGCTSLRDLDLRCSHNRPSLVRLTHLTSLTITAIKSQSFFAELIGLTNLCKLIVRVPDDRTAAMCDKALAPLKASGTETAIVTSANELNWYWGHVDDPLPEADA